ncbi:MAG: HAD family phosphatase [Anaerolineae bacterium]|nr:HAD family phosphatase [Phycisphaerae bacterium]
MFELPTDMTGLIFDCDGTIADTMPLHYRAWSTALREHGHDFPEALFYEMAGIPSVRIVELLNERHGYHMPPVETADRKERMYLETIQQVRAIEPVVQIVHQFAGKLPMAVATGGTRAIASKTLEALDVLQHFAALVTADDVAHGKPAPDIFLEAARRINVDPKFCCAFEDAELGLQSARAAGMLVIDVRPMHKASLRASLKEPR